MNAISARTIRITRRIRFALFDIDYAPLCRISGSCNRNRKPLEASDEANAQHLDFPGSGDRSPLVCEARRTSHSRSPIDRQTMPVLRLCQELISWEGDRVPVISPSPAKGG